eukprot:m.49839 g.49839  ORF g.49839 m.49839 type:complete len:335 (+) comp15342_c0_seq7:357-1361(+)
MSTSYATRVFFSGLASLQSPSLKSGFGSIAKNTRGITTTSLLRLDVDSIRSANQADVAENKQHNFKRISVVGSGVLAELLLRRMAHANGVTPLLTFFDITSERSSLLQQQHPGSTVAGTMQAAVRPDTDLLMLTVKPQNVDAVAAEIGGKIAPDTVVFSTLAGITVETLVKKLKTPKVVRAMPNTPCAVGEGMTVWTATKTLTDADRDGVEALFASTGENLFVDDENYIDMATAVSASGPAYVYLAMEAMVDAGVMMGFPRSIATKLVQSTFQGTGAYAMQSSRHLAQMRTDITSPGGTTAAALYGLEKGGMRTALCDAVFAAYNRTQELGREL